MSQLIRSLHDEDEEVRVEAAERLGDLGPAAGRAIPALAESLSDEEPGVRRAAAQALGSVGEGSGEEVAALEAALADDDVDVRTTAARALIARGTGDTYVVAVEALGTFPLEPGREDHLFLIGALLDERPDVRLAAAWALADAEMLPGIDYGAAAEQGRLEGLLRDADPVVRIAAAKTLMLAGSAAERATTTLLACLLEAGGYGWLADQAMSDAVSDESWSLLPGLREAFALYPDCSRKAAIFALGQVGVPDDDAFAMLVAAAADKDLRDDDESEPRGSLIRALARTGRGNPAAVGFLRKLALDDDLTIDELWTAVQELKTLSSGSEAALHALIEVLFRKRHFYLEGLLKDLIRVEERDYAKVKLDGALVVELTAALADATAGGLYQFIAEWILLSTGALPAETLDELRCLFWRLSDEGFGATTAACLGPEASARAVPALHRLLWDDDRTIVINAARALSVLDPSGVVPTLVSRLAEGRDYRRRPGGRDYGYCPSNWEVEGGPAAAALGLLGAEEAIPGLLDALDYGHPETRIEAARALGRILGAEAVPVLVQLLSDRCTAWGTRDFQPEGVRRAAAETLGSLGPMAREAVPALERVLEQGPDHETRETVEAALASIRRAGAESTPPEAGAGRVPDRLPA